jgi:hypothetical protein
VRGIPGVSAFKPVGVPARGLAEVVLGFDEYEAVRLADLEGLYHEQAAERMGVSRATFGRIVMSGRKKIADALVNGKVLVIKEGAAQSVQPETTVGEFPAMFGPGPGGRGRCGRGFRGGRCE